MRVMIQNCVEVQKEGRDGRVSARMQNAKARRKKEEVKEGSAAAEAEKLRRHGAAAADWLSQDCICCMHLSCSSRTFLLLLVTLE